MRCMTTNLKTAKETRLILQCQCRQSSCFSRTACCMLHAGISLLSTQKLWLQLRGPDAHCGADSFPVMLGNGADMNCPLRPCLFLGWAGRWTRAALLPLPRIFLLCAHIPSLWRSNLFPGDTHCLSLSGSLGEQPRFLPSHTEFPEPLAKELCSSKQRSSKELSLNLCQSAKHCLSVSWHTLLPFLGSWLLGLRASWGEGCRCPTLNQRFGKTLWEAVVRMEGLPFSLEVLSGWALSSCTEATFQLCLWPCLSSRLATHPRWTQVKECKKQLAHKASLALETKHHMLEQPEQKDEPKAKGAESRRAGEVLRESTRTSCFVLPPPSLWALLDNPEVPPLLSLQFWGGACPIHFLVSSL